MYKLTIEFSTLDELTDFVNGKAVSEPTTTVAKKSPAKKAATKKAEEKAEAKQVEAVKEAKVEATPVNRDLLIQHVQQGIQQLKTLQIADEEIATIIQGILGRAVKIGDLADNELVSFTERFLHAVKGKAETPVEQAASFI